jgi:predicted RecB family endonuclease
MEVAQIVLEYLKVLLSPQMVVGILTIVFIWLFKDDIKALILRIAKIKLPGGSEILVAQAEPIEQRQRLEEKIKAVAEDIEQPQKGPSGAIEVKEGAPPDISSTRQAYVLAEDLAFREIEGEFCISVRRHVTMGRGRELDGVFHRKGELVVVEIMYTRGPSKQRIPAIQIERLKDLVDVARLPASFLLAIVTDGLDRVQRESEAVRFQETANEAKLHLYVRVYDFETLKKKYGI